LPVARIDPGSGTVTVAFENVGFDALVDWLAALDADVGIGVDDLTIERRDDGQVAAEITLRER
ncbi:MAG: type II secretion system protein M, partial [Sphingomonadaceae bacterium]|nr:type II secretion system protein M [Sphingomonadaceae bacterium]